MFPQTSFKNQLLADTASINIVRFEATPSIVSPFGSSVLSWEVMGPSDTVVTINGIPVAPTGQRIIQPSVTRSFLLFASRQFPFEQQQASTSVTVNLSQCILRDNAFVGQFITFYLRRILSEDQRFTLLFPNFEIPAQVLPGHINFGVSVRYDDGTTFPPLNAFASASFRLITVSASPFLFSRRVVAASNVSVEVTPIPVNGVQSGVPDENKMIEVARKIKEIVPRLINSPGVLPTSSGLPANMILRSVSIEGPGVIYPKGGVTLTYCPEEGLVNLGA